MSDVTECVCAYSCRVVWGEGGGPCGAGMQGYETMRSWELWDVCTEGRQNVNKRTKSGGKHQHIISQQTNSEHTVRSGLGGTATWGGLGRLFGEGVVADRTGQEEENELTAN